MKQTRKDVLNGWKEIAAYLGRDPRTVERWEKQRLLPVRRLPGSGRATVYALVAELDEWLARSPVREAESQAAAEPMMGGAGFSEPGLHAAAGGAKTGVGQEIDIGRGGWLRWAGVAVVMAVLCGAGLAGVRWKRRPAGPRPAAADPAQEARLRRLVPSSPVFGVEELYLRGCYQSEMRTPESLGRAIDAFSAATVKDPRYAPAYSGLATAFILLREYAMVSDAEAYPKAKEAAGKALALDPELPQAHAAMGFVDFFWGWDGVAAEKEFQEAVRLDPALPLPHHWYGSMLTHQGRFREALAELDLAQRLDPTSAAILTSRAFALGLSGRRAAGADLLQEAISSDGTGQYRNPATMHHVLGVLSLLPPRDIPRYLAETRAAAELRRDDETVAVMQLGAEVYHAHGEQAMWRALLQEEKKRHASGGPTYSMARYEAELGAREQAMNDLADLFSRHDSELIGISVDPLFAGVRKEPRFMQLQSAMGLPRSEQD